MQDIVGALSADLKGRDKADWLEQLTAIADEHGYFQPLGDRHFATFLDHGLTLLVTFEPLQNAMAGSGEPLGWQMVRDRGWSTLSMVCDGDTWFRDPKVYGYFDRLVDDGFFEDFDRVVFYGAEACGYAAAAFSVAAPGATVLAVQPQATLDPAVTIWDPRFRHMRRTSFTDRYGFAPDMLDAANRAFILFDPNEMLDAMHAALFTGPNVTHLRMRMMGGNLHGSMAAMGLLPQLLAAAGDGTLTAASFARMARLRRDHPPYLRNLLAAVDRGGRDYLTAALCRNVIARLNAPRFARRLAALEKAADKGDVRLPPTAPRSQPAFASQ